jgi:hypothetical protein
LQEQVQELQRQMRKQQNLLEQMQRQVQGKVDAPEKEENGW